MTPEQSMDAVANAMWEQFTLPLLGYLGLALMGLMLVSLLLGFAGHLWRGLTQSSISPRTRRRRSR